MSSITLRPAAVDDLSEILKMQKSAFTELLEKYRDYDTNPGSETLDDLLRRFRQEGSVYYFILCGEIRIGVIRVVDNHDAGTRKRISPVFILPQYQGNGYAQAAIREVQRLHGAENWSLETILQEPKNCHLYEKCGYRRTGQRKVINDKLTLVFYEKD